MVPILNKCSYHYSLKSNKELILNFSTSVTLKQEGNVKEGLTVKIIKYCTTLSVTSLSRYSIYLVSVSPNEPYTFIQGCEQKIILH